MRVGVAAASCLYGERPASAPSKHTRPVYLRGPESETRMKSGSIKGKACQAIYVSVAVFCTLRVKAASVEDGPNELGQQAGLDAFTSAYPGPSPVAEGQRVDNDVEMGR